MRAIRCVVALAAGMAVFGAAAQSRTPRTPLELTTDNVAGVVDPLMLRWTSKNKGPGAVVVVVTRDAQIFAEGYGFSDVAARKPFTADTTLVRPGSISKLFTAIAVMQLVDAGKLDLDRDVNGYIDFAIPTPEGGVPVTLRRLLTHRAGFEEHMKGLFSRNPEPAPLGRWLADDLPRRLFPNGDVEAYSNYGFALAGYIVERVSGEPYAGYIQRHILDPLGMSHSTFRQPLPDDLAPLMAKSYRASDKPPLPFFETITAPAGALSATGTDMGRFIRALLNGGELDGVRILAKARLDEMMAPGNSTPAGYLGLVFFGTKVADRDSIGHNGGTMIFSSELKLFREQGVGVFTSLDGIGEIKAAGDIPRVTAAIARRFLPRAPREAEASAATLSGDAELVGAYHLSRRADSSILRFNDLVSQRLLRADSAGAIRSFASIWPFGNGGDVKRAGTGLYDVAGFGRLALVEDAGSESYLAEPALLLQRVPWFLDARWIVPAFVASAAVAFLTLLAWPVAALWRYWRKRRWSEDRGDRRRHLAVRLVLLVDAAVIVVMLVLFFKGSLDFTILSDALDPVVLALYALAWLGVGGAVLALWAAIRFWLNGAGSRWSRVHHTLIAASTVMLAWFFVVFRIAGTTLNY